MKLGSYAIKESEPRQDRKVAAVRTTFMCRKVAWVELNVARTDLSAGFD